MFIKEYIKRKIKGITRLIGVSLVAVSAKNTGTKPDRKAVKSATFVFFVIFLEIR